MNALKKSSAKSIVFIITAVLISLIALFRLPSFKPMLSYTQHITWQDFILDVESGSDNEAQTLWEFREFYSRGIIYLSKFQELQIPETLTEFYTIPNSFVPHTLFHSDKIDSIEGFIDADTNPFLTQEDVHESGWAIHVQTDQIQIVRNHSETGFLIIATFDLETASQANGYLYFDMRDKNFAEEHKNKKWVVISFVKI